MLRISMENGEFRWFFTWCHFVATMLQLSAPCFMVCSAFLDSSNPPDFSKVGKESVDERWGGDTALLISSKVERKRTGCRSPPTAGRKLNP
jgi:hypothetical protein